jgi:hypothetical protein
MTRTSDPRPAPERPDAPIGSSAGASFAADDERTVAADRVAVRPGFGDRALRYVSKSLQQIALCLILYVASTGPMYWRCYEAYFLNGSSFLAKLYLPLVVLCQHEPAFSRFMDWYVGLWIFPHAEAVDPPPRPPVSTPSADETQDAATPGEAATPT